MSSYRTKDLPTATFLSAKNYAYTLAVPDVRRVVFVEFQRTPELETDLDELSRGSATVAPLAYEFARQRLLAEIKAAKQGGGRDA